jgi:hypothetical protein
MVKRPGKPRPDPSRTATNDTARKSLAVVDEGLCPRPQCAPSVTLLSATMAQVPESYGSQTHGFETALGPVFLFRYKGRTEQAWTSFIIDEADATRRFVMNSLRRLTFLSQRLVLRTLGLDTGNELA